MDLDFFHKSPTIHNTLFGDGFTFTGGDLFGGISLEESVNAGDDLTIGSCVMSSIGFQLENLNFLINGLAGKELVWKQSVETGRKGYPSLARASRGNPICIHGAAAYACNAQEPYLSIWNAETSTKIKDADSQPEKPVKGLAVAGDILYCLHDEPPYATAYHISGQDLTPAATPALNSFFQNKIRYLCRNRYAVNVQGNLLKRYKVDLRDLRPDNLTETAYEYIQMGVFLAEKPEKINDTRIRVKCCDRLSLFGRYVDGWLDGLAYPLTLKAMLQGLCAHVGVPYVDTVFPNQGYSIRRNFTGENVSGLQVLRWIAEIAARFGRMDEQGRFSLAWYQEKPFTIDSAVFASVEVEDYVTAKIEKVQAKSTENDIGVIVPPSAPEAGNTLVLSSNPLLYAESDAELRPTVESIYNAVKDISYQPYSVAMRWEIPLLHAGDIVALTTRKGQSFPAYLMSRSLGSAADAYEAAGNERRETQSDAVKQSIQRLRGKTNEIVATIEEFSVTLTDVSTRTEENEKGIQDNAAKIVKNSAQILAQADEIALRVTQTEYDNYTQQNDKAVRENSAQIQVQADEILSRVTKSEYAAYTGKNDKAVNELGKQIKTAESSIAQNAEAITSKVSTTDYNGTTIASLINQTATSVLIQADRINLEGYVTTNSLSTGDLTVWGTFINENGKERIGIDDGFITFYYNNVAKGRVYTNPNTGEGIVVEAGTSESDQGPLTFAAGGYLRGEISENGTFNNNGYKIMTTGPMQAGTITATNGYKAGSYTGLTGRLALGDHSIEVRGGIVTKYI